jgi:post-segregation antitoxin (ccd killing protein)
VNRLHTGPHQTNDNLSSPGQKANADAPAETKTNDWHTENTAFVAAYNELIDAEGVALEEYRLF